MILGISVDDVASHQQFAEEQGHSQMLLADLKVLEEGKAGGS